MHALLSAYMCLIDVTNIKLGSCATTYNHFSVSHWLYCYNRAVAGQCSVSKPVGMLLNL